MKRAIKREIILVCGVILLSIALYFVPSAPKAAGTAGRTLPAKVLEVDNSELTRHGLVLYGSQKLTVDVGGKTFTANNQLRGQMELDKVFKKGDAAVVVLQPGDTPQKSVLTAQDFYRNFWSLYCKYILKFRFRFHDGIIYRNSPVYSRKLLLNAAAIILNPNVP